MVEGERGTRKRKKRTTEGLSSSPSSTNVTWPSALLPSAICRRGSAYGRPFSLGNMLVSSRAAFIGTLLATTLFSVLFLSSTTWRVGNALTLISPPTIHGPHSSLERNSMPTLNVASRIYVISLPKDTRRRAGMEQLRYTLGLDFTYVNGTESNGDTVQRIMRHVAALRTPEGSHETNPSLSIPFEWPQDADALVESESFLDRQGSDLWLSDDMKPYDSPFREPLTCASGNSTLESYSPQTPPYRLLTKERLACWHSHWRVIRLIADGQDGASFVLEDDVDMELDIRQRLLGVWDSLPSVWDIVFLGSVVIRARLSSNVTLTAIQVTVGLKSQRSPPLSPTTPRSQALQCPLQLFTPRPHRSVHTHMHCPGEGHGGWRCTYGILPLHTRGRLIRRSLGW